MSRCQSLIFAVQSLKYCAVSTPHGFGGTVDTQTHKGYVGPVQLRTRLGTWFQLVKIHVSRIHFLVAEPVPTAHEGTLVEKDHYLVLGVLGGYIINKV